jgi:hypothetical protein
MPEVSRVGVPYRKINISDSGVFAIGLKQIAVRAFERARRGRWEIDQWNIAS